MQATVVIVGLGEVGKPLLEIMKSGYQTFGVDINQPASVSECDVMHICFPFQNGVFVGQVVEYIRQYHPALTVINSTVAPGTTRHIAAESDTAAVLRTTPLSSATSCTSAPTSGVPAMLSRTIPLTVASG